MIDLRYLAGLIDGEGCVTIFRHRTVECREDHWTYRPLVQIGMIHKPLLYLICAEYGGKVHLKKAPDSTRRSSATWSLRGGRCIELMKQIEPFLIVKKAEAQLLIQYWNDPEARLRGGTMKGMHGAAREALKAKREWYRLQLQALKRIEFGFSWDAGEFGEYPERTTPSQAGEQSPGVCNEHGPAPKGEMCSELGRNVESAAETIAPLRLRSVG